MASLIGTHFRLSIPKNTMTISMIQLWHKRARPEPTQQNFNVQLGCHIEEIVEMLDTLKFKNFDWSVCHQQLDLLASLLKRGDEDAVVTDRKEFLDSLADQVVTAVGTGHCANMDVPTACIRVNTSNWSKYDSKGYPIFNEFGKITKGTDYKAPDLEGLY